MLSFALLDRFLAPSRSPNSSVNGDGLTAGHYIGAVAAEAPEDIGPANITLNLKREDGVFFWTTRDEVLTDPFFWVSTGLAAAFAVAAAATIYAQNSGWRADPVVDAFAVVSAVIAAAGFRSLIATAASK